MLIVTLIKLKAANLKKVGEVHVAHYNLLLVKYCVHVCAML